MHASLSSHSLPSLQPWLAAANIIAGICNQRSIPNSDKMQGYYNMSRAMVVSDFSATAWPLHIQMMLPALPCTCQSLGKTSPLSISIHNHVRELADENKITEIENLGRKFGALNTFSLVILPGSNQKTSDHRNTSDNRNDPSYYMNLGWPPTLFMGVMTCFNKSKRNKSDREINTLSAAYRTLTRQGTDPRIKGQ